MDAPDAAEPSGAEQDSAALAARETHLADQEGQRAVREREDGEASTSTWARRLHERSAQHHDRAEMGYRDAAERHAMQAERQADTEQTARGAGSDTGPDRSSD